MELKIQKKDLLKGLEKTLSVVERRNTMPSLNHALFELNDNQLKISATDLEIFVSSTVPCKSLTNGRLAIPARALFEIVKECGDASDIHLRALEGNRLEIISGKTQFKLLGLASDQFPHFKTSPKGQLSKAKLSCAEFVQLIQKTEHSVCLEEIRYFLTGIYLETVNDGKNSFIRAVATDGHRLAMMDLPQSKTGSLDLKKGLIIPKKGVSELRKLLETTNQESFEISCDENLLQINLGDYQLWIRPIDGEYPDYKRVIPTGLTSKAIVSKKEFSTSLRRMNLLVSDRSKVVTFDFKKDKIAMSTVNPDVGEATDEVACQYDGGELKTGFNVRFYLDAISHFDGDTIEVELGEKLQPALIKCADNPGYLVVVMPMRI